MPSVATRNDNLFHDSRTSKAPEEYPYLDQTVNTFLRRSLWVFDEADVLTLVKLHLPMKDRISD